MTAFWKARKEAYGLEDLEKKVVTKRRMKAMLREAGRLFFRLPNCKKRDFIRESNEF